MKLFPNINMFVSRMKFVFINRAKSQEPRCKISYLVILSWFLVLVSWFSVISAQTVDTNKTVPYVAPPKFSFGLKAGINVAQIFGTGAQGINHIGFAGGFRFTYRFHERFSFDPEVLYNMKGAARYPNVEKGDYESFFVDLDYIEVPVIFNFHFGKRRNFSFEFGPSIGFLVRESITYNGGLINNPTSSFNVYDISFLVGLNYSLPKGFGLNFRYMNSIAPIQPSLPPPSGNPFMVGLGQLNSVINFSLSYRFNFSKRVILENGTVKDRPFKEKPVKEKKVKKQKGDVVDEE